MSEEIRELEKKMNLPREIEVPLVGRTGKLLCLVLGGGFFAVVFIWPDLTPQLVITTLGVGTAIVAADVFLIRREVRLALRSALTAPEAKEFVDTWQTIRRMIVRFDAWWKDHGEEATETVVKLSKIAKDIADRYPIARPKMKRVKKI